MSIRLYMDEDSMESGLVRALRARSVDIVTAFEANMIKRTDAEHLEYATSQRRVLCTFNIGDFYRLHTDYLTQGKFHIGIILMQQQRYGVGEQLRRLLRLIADKSMDKMENQVEFLAHWN
ncbi:MAG: hypothetical protein EXR62_03670 [Chloroflexi bacterium]|nr:hypothetical protein [Chloroflexota bacterium]